MAHIGRVIVSQDGSDLRLCSSCTATFGAIVVPSWVEDTNHDVERHSTVKQAGSFPAAADIWKLTAEFGKCQMYTSNMYNSLYPPYSGRWSGRSNRAA
jgi:hypothetical protein